MNLKTDRKPIKCSKANSLHYRVFDPRPAPQAIRWRSDLGRGKRRQTLRFCRSALGPAHKDWRSAMRLGIRIIVRVGTSQQHPWSDVSLVSVSLWLQALAQNRSSTRTPPPTPTCSESTTFSLIFVLVVRTVKYCQVRETLKAITHSTR